MGEIDVSAALDDIEGTLQARTGSAQARELLGILQRWQWDTMLCEASRERARALLEQFSRE